MENASIRHFESKIIILLYPSDAMKKIFFILVLAALLFPNSSHAQVDARCWYKDDCITAREGLKSGLTPEEIEKGFVQNAVSQNLCKGVHQTETNPIGFCLPSTNAKIKIAIGGQTEFTGLAEFIAFIYKYGMGLAGILSVLVLIFAGVQWIISGGNAETISKAKHKIVGAVIGMVILAAAYTILYTVNPDLVNLRPPNAWMINTLNLPTNPSCLALKPNEKISRQYLKTADNTTVEKKQEIFATLPTDGWLTPTSTFFPDNSQIAKTAHCGYDYFIEKTNALTCRGNFCNPGAVCISVLDDPEKKLYCNAKEGHSQIAGNITNSDFTGQTVGQVGNFLASLGAGALTDFWAWEWVEAIGLMGICANDGEPDNWDRPLIPQYKNENTLTQQYFLYFTESQLNNAISSCGQNNFRGFLLLLLMNLPNDPIEYEGHLVGKNNTDICDLKHRLVSCAVGSENLCEDQCEKILKKSANPGIPDELFFTKEELMQGILYNIDVGPFPSIDNDDDRRKQYYGKFGWTP